MVFKPRRVKTQNIEIKCMLTTVLKMGVDNFLYACYGQLYLGTYSSRSEHEENCFIFSTKRVGVFTVRLQSLGCKRLDTYLQIHTHHSLFFYKYNLHAFCRLEIIFHVAAYEKRLRLFNLVSNVSFHLLKLYFNC